MNYFFNIIVKFAFFLFLFLFYLDHFSHVFLLLLFLLRLFFFFRDSVFDDERRIRRRVICIFLCYNAYFVFLNDRVILRQVSSTSSKGWFAPSGTTRAISWLTTVSTCSHCRLEHQEIGFRDFESVETCFEAVTIPQTI